MADGDKLRTLSVTGRAAWRAWLERHFETEREIWLVFPKQASGGPRISYNDAVEEALCFGWIDSTVRAIDEGHTAQRFTPRRPGSGYSQPNKERLRWLLKQGLLHPSVVPAARAALRGRFIFPADIIEAIKADPQACVHYRKFSPAYKRIRLAYIEAARGRPEEFRKRLAHFIEKTRQNKQIGYGGIEKYY